jgi:hypothetical protein
MACRCQKNACTCNLSTEQVKKGMHAAINRMENSGIASPQTANLMRNNVDNKSKK